MGSEIATLDSEKSVTLKLAFHQINTSSIIQFRDVRLEALRRGAKVECWRDDNTMEQCMRITKSDEKEG